MKNILFLLAIGFFSTIANAENGMSNLELWDALDVNKDDLISQSEASSKEGIIERWDEFDRNEDGVLDFFEFSRVPSQE